MKIIAFDVDSVLAEIMVPWLKGYNRDYGDNLTVDQITGWEMTRYVKPECGSKIYGYLTPELYDDTPVIPGAVSAVEMARRYGRVIFVTSAQHTPGRKFFWLNQHGFYVNIKDYVECMDKGLIRADVLVDDYEVNLVEFPKGILFDQPWNRHSNLRRTVGFDNFRELLETK